MNPMLVQAMRDRGFVYKRPKQVIHSLQEKQKPKHVHNWSLYKQYVGVDNHMRQHTFILRGCPDCQEKHVVDLKLT